jgi:signal transduction histidine kinase
MPKFRTKARAVDLLGKGQIADLPTAITELWKNGYDAYAKNVTAEIYLKGYKGSQTDLFLITDDGKGMSKNDIFDKWLVLGTDSKSRGDTEDEAGIDTLWQEPRIKAGEKGIGRLSVAFLGSTMLMLTKKIGFPLQAMLIDWRLLENFNLFLDDVQIPVEDIKEGENIIAKFETLRDTFRKNFDTELDEEDKPIWAGKQIKLRNDILKSLDSVQLPVFFEDEILEGMLNLADDHGTKFLVFEPEEQVLNLLNNDIENNDSTFVRTSLAGFTNQFKEQKLPIKTAFPIHKETGSDYDYLTGSGNFFDYKDYDLADILIDGTFDGSGSFEGNITIYDKTLFYKYTNPRKKDIRNFYGSFPLKLGYSLGNTEDSKLETDLFNKLNEKVNNFGALYVYRDDFRVLPYGRTDSDFLEFEKRRNKRIGTAFFSHRRMFGYIGLTRGKNPDLKDKSSREGLINNAQYRVFKDDLENFFIEVAKEYFSDTAKQSIFLDEKKQKNDQALAIQQDKARETVAKREFTKSLQEYPKRFQEYQRQYVRLLDDLDEKITSSNVIYYEIEETLEQLRELDINYKALLPQVSKVYAPTDLQLERLYKYEDQLNKFNETTKANSLELMERVQRELEIKDLRIELSKQVQRYKGELETLLYEHRKELEDKFGQIIEEYGSRSKSILSQLNEYNDSIALTINSKEGVIDGIRDIQKCFDFLREQVDRELSPLVKHIKKLSFDIDEELIQGAYKAEYEAIKYQWEQTRETAQLGIAVEIIDHEFNVLYSQINSILNKIDKDIPPTLISVFNNLKKSFSSLEDKYELLSPLYRISGATVKKIGCSSIFEYLKDFFERKLSSERVDFSATDLFLNHVIEIKEPVIHTVFINIINNAIYWVRNSEDKRIILDYLPETKELLMINSGLPIEDYRLDKIFELFYSNRPNGRGIGLYLSKQSLNENYFDIYATNDPYYNRLKGACFVIKPLR